MTDKATPPLLGQLTAVCGHAERTSDGCPACERMKATWGKPRCTTVDRGDGHSRGRKRCLKKLGHPGDCMLGNP